MPHKYFKGQLDDEEVLLVFRRHPVVMRRGLIYFMLAILAGTIPSLINPEMSWLFGGLAGGFVLAIIVMMPSWIAWYFSLFIMTDQRFIQITQKGLFHRSVSDLGLKHIQTLNYEIDGLEQTLLGFGTIVVQTYLGDLVIHHIHHPEKTVREISEILREHGVEVTDYPAEALMKEADEEDQ